MTDYRDTPILLLIFNRPDKVRRLIDRLREFKPKYLYISADGPRVERGGEVTLCLEAREVATKIDWPCEVHTYFSETNKGCKKGVSDGITWFFNNVKAGIILEDDCLPTEAFLVFAADMLNRYELSHEIMHINGTSFLSATGVTVHEPFFFSRIAHSWGWASWRRAWQKIDLEMKDADLLKEKLTADSGYRKKYTSFWTRHFTHIRNKKIDSWANPWLYSIMIQNGLCITPTANLIENIGFDNSASNTKDRPRFAQSANEVLSHLHEPVSKNPRTDVDEKITDLVFRKTIFEKLYLRLTNGIMRLFGK